MCHLVGDVFGVLAAISLYPLRDLLCVAFEVAHGTSVDLLEGFAHAVVVMTQILDGNMGQVCPVLHL